MRKCKEIKDKKKLEEWKDVLVEVTVAMIPIIATFLVAVGTCIVFYWIGKRGISSMEWLTGLWIFTIGFFKILWDIVGIYIIIGIILIVVYSFFKKNFFNKKGMK